MIGRSAVDFIHHADLESTREEMRQARRGHQMRNFECRYLHKDGRVIPMAWTGVWSEPEEQHFFIGRDMTERIRLESQLRQAQKMEAVGQLTGGVAHDFNNILTVIAGSIDTLAQAAGNDAKLAAIVKSIDDAAERGARLTQRMLAFARKRPLQSKDFDLNEIVGRMAEMLERTLGEDITLKTTLARDLWPTCGDPAQVEDAILNLAVNARDAMPKGGALVIETANAVLDEHYAAQNLDVAPGEYVAVVITDSGTGMPPEVIERAFEPFFTTKDVGRGTGLGLSMVYGLAKQSHGHVKIYSELGHGTSIRLYLPRAANAAAAPERRAAELRPGGHETVLVVEDDPAVRMVALNILKSIGYRVLEAPDGKAALEILRGPGAIDLLFTDLVMPNGMGGQDLLRAARAERPGLKALFTSGYSEQFIKQRGDAMGSVALLGKPYRRQQLAEAVRRALDAG
jgi:signal transduction histidine kinase